MARRLLKDTCELAAEILDGKHDANLAYIIQAAQARQKRAVAEVVRVGQRIRIEASCPDVKCRGAEATVEKVNQKTIDLSNFWRIPMQWVTAGHVTVVG